MAHWVRFRHAGSTAFGTLTGDLIDVHRGDLFDAPEPTGGRLPLDEVELLAPCQPTKMVALWNNFHERARREGWERPPNPLLFLKTPNSFSAHGRPIRRPAAYDGPVVYEAELGVVIGRRATAVPVERADEYIFGYTCVNDVTARAILKSDPSFPQWTRAKGFDTFCPFGPVIATGVEPDALRVCAVVNGRVTQDYPVSDMFYRPRQLVSLVSRDMSLEPGDVIACGTSFGNGPMEPGDRVEVAIDGVGTLVNVFVSAG